LDNNKQPERGGAKNTTHSCLKFWHTEGLPVSQSLLFLPGTARGCGRHQKRLAEVEGGNGDESRSLPRDYNNGLAFLGILDDWGQLWLLCKRLVFNRKDSRR